MPAPSADLGVRVSQSQLSGRASVGLAGLMKSCTMTETHRRTAAGAGGHGPPALEVWTARTVRYVWRPSRPTAAHTATHRHMLMQWFQAAYVPQFHTSRGLARRRRRGLHRYSIVHVAPFSKREVFAHRADALVYPRRLESRLFCSIRTYTAAIPCYNNITARRQGRGSQVVRSTRLTRSSPHPLTTTVHTKLEIMSAAIHVIKGRLVTGLSLQDSRFGRGAPMAKRIKQRTRGADRRQSSSSNYPQISSCACRVPTVSVLACRVDA